MTEKSSLPALAELARLPNGPRYKFGAYATVIFDEVHECGAADFPTVQAAVDEARDDFRVLLMRSPPLVETLRDTKAVSIKKVRQTLPLREDAIFKKAGKWPLHETTDVAQW